MIQVLKRDCSVEPFRPERLRLCLYRAMGGTGGRFDEAHQLARAIGIYLRRARCRVATSRAVLEMAFKALRQTGHGDAAEALEAHHQWRRGARQRLVVAHPSGRRCAWDRSWVTEQIQHRWDVPRPVARTLSADIEGELLRRGGRIDRQTVLDLVDERVENYGLAPWCLMASAPSL